MFRYKLRTLLMVLAFAPPVLAGAWFLTRSETGILILILVAVMIVFVISGQAFHRPIEPPPNQQ